MLDTLDAPAVRRWSTIAAQQLSSHRAEIDDLNVYPVPDRDTGTNLAHTLRAALTALDGEPAPGAGAALHAMASGAVLGARGNSGVIVSQILRGLADSVGGADFVDAVALQLALRRAAEQAYLSVSEPVEGTILSVVRAAAEAAQGIQVTLHEVVLAALSGAVAALRRTTGQLPELASAGVVDAGGRGLVVLLDALARVVGDVSDLPLPAPETTAPSHPRAATGPAYEVQYLIDSDDAAIAALGAELAPLGDSLVVAGTGTGTWNVHVHVDDIGAAIEAGVRAGRPHRITVTRFDDQFQLDEPVWPGTGAATPRTAPAGTTAVVAVGPTPALAHLFLAEGVSVVDGHSGDAPTVGDVLAGMRATGSDHVILLPISAAVAAVVEQAARDGRAEGMEVAVVHARAPVQGLAAVAVHDGGQLFGVDVVAMAEAAAATRWAEVTVAEREALTLAGRCQAGDVLGLIDGEVVEIGSNVGGVALAVLDRLLGIGGELVTVILGLDAAPGSGAALRSYVEVHAPGTEVAVLPGGQLHSPLLIGME